MSTQVILYEGPYGGRCIQPDRVVPRDIEPPQGFELSGGKRDCAVFYVGGRVTIAISSGYSRNAGHCFQQNLDKDFPRQEYVGSMPISFNRRRAGEWQARLDACGADAERLYLIVDASVINNLSRALKMPIVFYRRENQRVLEGKPHSKA